MKEFQEDGFWAWVWAAGAVGLVAADVDWVEVAAGVVDDSDDFSSFEGTLAGSASPLE